MGQLIDVATVTGLIILERSSLSGMNIHVYKPFSELEKRFANKALALGRPCQSTDTRSFEEALEHPWSTLGLLSQACYEWLGESKRAERFLEAMIAYWSVVDAVGPRYTTGINRGQRLWEMHHLPKFVLARRGVPKHRLTEPLPPGGISALLPVRN